MSEEIVYSTIAILALAAMIPLGMLLTGFLGPRVANKTKNEIYESGIKRVIGAANQKFSVKFYLVAILFLIFDIEAVFMYPWAVNLRELGWFGFVEMVVFMLLLLAGLVYILRKGVLHWH